MNKKKKSSPETHSEVTSSKNQDENPDRRDTNPADKTGPPKKEVPITGGPHHPHLEEILDGIPE